MNLKHIRRLLPGMAVVVGSVMVVGSIEAGARGLRGYEDVFQFLASFGFGVFFVWFGWYLSR